MPSAAVTIDIREIKKLAGILNGVSLDAGERRKLLQALGTELEDQTKERFDTKTSPAGGTWQEVSERHRAYLAREFPGAEPPLVVEGYLRDSVESQASDWAVLTGATRIYAAVHQFGWPEKNIPARPYIGVSEENADDLAAIAEDFLESIMRRAS